MEQEEEQERERYSKLVELTRQEIGERKYTISTSLSPTDIVIQKSATLNEQDWFRVDFPKREISVYSQEVLETAVSLARKYESFVNQEFTVRKRYESFELANI